MWMSQVLLECHKRGVVHSDVKPVNLMNSLDKLHVTLIDFGTASVCNGAHTLHQRQSKGYILACVGKEISRIGVSSGQGEADMDWGRLRHIHMIQQGMAMWCRYTDDVWCTALSSSFHNVDS
jgi:serine/threonine protein kinase